MFNFEDVKTPSPSESLSLSPSLSPVSPSGRPSSVAKPLTDDVSKLVQADDSHLTVTPYDEPRDADYYLDTAIFEVEGTLYKVAKYHFLKGQDFFVPKFAKSKSETDVICLDNVSKNDFRTFLNLLYPLSIASTISFSTKEWITILKLSTQWTMLDIRNLAIRQLNVAKIDPVDRIVLSQKYSIPQWLSSSLVLLIRREESLSTTEAKKLGFKLALTICRVRDSSRNLPDFLNDDAWSSAISAEFQKELRLPTLSAIERVVTAREIGVLEFLRTSYLDLVERPGPLSDEEAQKLGCETTVRICRLREQRIMGTPSTMSGMDLLENELQAELSTTKSVTAIGRVVMTRDNVGEWLRTSLVEAAQRRQFSGDEVEILGEETTIGLYRVRETIHRTQWGSKPHGVCQNMINVEFGVEIRAARDGAKRYGGTEEASVVDEIVEPEADRYNDDEGDDRYVYSDDKPRSSGKGSKGKSGQKSRY